MGRISAARMAAVVVTLGVGAVGLFGSPLACSSPGALKDQNGTLRGLEDHAGEVQVAIVVSAKRLRRIKPWERSLAEAFESLPVLRVADVPRTSPTEYAVVAEKLRKRLPEGVNVLVDLEGVWATSYDLDVSKPSILIFDAAGELHSVHSGMYKAARFAVVRADVERMLSLPAVSSALGNQTGDDPAGNTGAEQ